MISISRYGTAPAGASPQSKPWGTLMVRLALSLVVLLLPIVLGSGPARATDPAADPTADPTVGREVAERWCASCHAIDPGRASDEQAPTFEAIVGERGRSDEWISTWLSTPHEVMPDLALTRDEIAALVAYFNSLRPAP